MKILLAHTYYQKPGGEDTVFAQEVDLLRDAGHEVVTYVRTNEEIANYGFVDKALLFPRTVWSSHSRTEFGTVLDRERPDIAHFHNTFIVMSPSVYAACKQRNIPVVQTLHNFRLSCPAATFFRDGSPCQECSTKSVWHAVRHKCYRQSRIATAAVASMIAFNRMRHTWSNDVDCFIALSEFARETLCDTAISPEKVFVKPNFLAPDPGPRRHHEGYAVFVGRLVIEKGVWALMAAWQSLNGSLPLRVIGSGPEQQFLERYCQTQNVKNVEFLGQMPRSQVLEQIRAARCLIFPSQYFENFPMTIVEAYANGVPVIASDIGSVAEIVHDGITGVTFAPGNAAELASRMEWAISNPDLLEEMGRRARAEYEVKYTAKRNYEMLMNIYQHALRRKLQPQLKAAFEAA